MLDTGTVVFGKELEGDFSGYSPGPVEFGDALLDGSKVGKSAPLPGCVDVGGQNAIPRLGQGGVLVADKAMKGRARCLENGETCDGAGDVNAIPAADANFGVASLAGILDKAMGMGLAVDVHSNPPVGDDLDVGNVDVAVLLNEMLAQERGKPFRWIDGMLLGHDEDGVFDGVGGDYDTVIGVRVRGGNVAFEQTANGHFGDTLEAGCLVAIDFKKADIVLAIASGGHVRHGWTGPVFERVLV